jgi:hypothetical protein
MAESEDARQIRKLRELLVHIDGQIEFIEHTFISNVYKSFQSKFKSHAYKHKQSELTAQWEEEYKKIQTLLESYKKQKNTLDTIVKYIRGGRAINGIIKGGIQTIANTIDNYLDVVLDSLIHEYPPRNTIPGNFVRRHVARSRSRSRSPVRTRLQGPLKSSFINSKRHMRNRSRSPNRGRNESRNRNRNRNGNRNENRQRTIRFKNKTEKYEIESLKTSNPFNNRSAVTHTPKEIKNMSRKGTKNYFEIYGNKPTLRRRLRRWMLSPPIQDATNAGATIAREAATAAAAAAEEARRIVSTISPTAPIFEAIQTAAGEADTAARSAARDVDIADESFGVDAAYDAARRAVAARDVAIAALEEIRRTIASSPSAPAAAAASSSNRRNST